MSALPPMSTLQWLTKNEWSMGNGQCPECFQLPYPWRGHPIEMVGHKATCQLAQAIREAGGKTVMQGDAKG